jgi:hypothetical protein
MFEQIHKNKWEMGNKWEINGKMGVSNLYIERYILWVGGNKRENGKWENGNKWE